MPVTTEELQKIVDRAVSVLQKHAPPDGLTDQQALKEFYRIFDSPAQWKALPKGSAAKHPADSAVQPFKIRQMASSRRMS